MPSDFSDEQEFERFNLKEPKAEPGPELDDFFENEIDSNQEELLPFKIINETPEPEEEEE
jgi:hypothetical protein